jgi:hypothetical protein
MLTWLVLILALNCIGCTITNPKVNCKYDPVQCNPEGLERTETHLPKVNLILYPINDATRGLQYSLSSNLSQLQVEVSEEDLQNIIQNVLADPRLIYTLTTKDLPPSTIVTLHTEDHLWLSAAPGLSQYPSMNMSASVRLNPHDSVAVVYSNQIIFVPVFSTSVHLVSDGAPSTHCLFAFETTITFAVELVAHIEADNFIIINGVFSTWDRPDIIVTNSTVGTVSTLELDYMLSKLLNSPTLSQAIKIASLTFSNNDLVLSNPSIKIQENIIFIVANTQYKD